MTDAVHDHDGLKIGRYRLALTGWNDWREWFTGGWKWRNFTAIHFGVEVGDYKGGYVEIHGCLLGLHLQLEWYDWPDRLEALSPIERMRQDFLEREDS